MSDQRGDQVTRTEMVATVERTEVRLGRLERLLGIDALGDGLEVRATVVGSAEIAGPR